MNLKEVLKIADEVVFTRTGKHLDKVQQEILRATLQSENYKQIAKKLDKSEGYVRQIGAQLWQIFSDILGEIVTKQNFSTAMERLQVSIFSHFAQDYVQISTVNFFDTPRSRIRGDS